MNEIPKISITQDFTDDEDIDSEYAGNIEDILTDVEELDSDEKKNQLPSSQLLKTLKKVKPKNKDYSATDIEDCQDSGSNDSVDLMQDFEEHLSLNEFLDQGFIEETVCGDNDKIKHSRRTKHSRLNVPKEDDGAVTDCEDLNTSDNELIIEEIPNDFKFDNFLIENDDFGSFHVENSKYVHNKNIFMNGMSNVDGSDSNFHRRNWEETSDVENIAFSDQEDQNTFPDHINQCANAFDAEEIILEASDNDDAFFKSEAIPEICVEFKSNRTKKLRFSSNRQKNRNSLSVQPIPDEAVTDVENIDSSDDEGFNLKKNMIIPIAYVNTSSKPYTDVEDFDVDDDCIATTSNDIKLPSPVREITVMREDQHGDPVAKVMPLVLSANRSFLGIREDYVEKGLTDTEDMSGNEEDYDDDVNYEIVEIPNMDGGIVSSAEGLTSFSRNQKSAEHEQLTDIEEIRVSSERYLRRKRLKKSLKTKGGLLDVNGDECGDVTENEELYLSDIETDLNRIIVHEQRNHEDAYTDTEEFSGDENTIKKCNNEIDVHVLQQEAFFSTITSTDGGQGKPLSQHGHSKISTTIKTCEEKQESSADMSYTDVEELEQTEGDDFLDVDSQSRGVESPQKLEDDLNDASSTNDSRSLRSLITPKPTPRSFNPNNYDAIASETVDDVHTSEIDKDDNRACTAIDRSSGDFSETKKFWQSLESGSIDDPNISPIPKPRSQSHVQVRGVRYINDDFDTVNLLTSITPNEQNISQTSLSNKDIDRHNVPITDHLNNVSPKLSDHNDIILHSAEKYSASIYNVKERENILDDDDDEDVLNEKKTAAFYIGESSGDLITKSAIEKQPIIAYDIDGKELKDVVKLDQKTEIECSDYKYEVRFNLQPEEIGVASYGKLDNIQQIRMHKSLEEKCETEIPENVILESPNSNDQAECSKSCDTSLEQATINFQSKIELKETAEQFEYTAPTCTISKSQEIEKNIDEERIETFEPVKMAETILLQSDHSTRKILDSTEKVQFHDKAVKVCHAPIDTLSNVSQNIDEIKIASNERRKNEKSQFEFDSNMEHYDIIEPKTTLVVNIPVENLNQEQYIEVEAIESESTQKPKFQANFVHEFSDKITSEIIKPEDNIIDYTLDPDEDKIYPVAHMNMLLRQECSNKMETRVGEVSQKQSTDESSLTTSKSEVIHRTGSSKGASKTRWSLNEQDHSSPSSHSVDNSRPCSSDIENLYVSYPNSSGEYQTALDASSLIPGSTEYHTAVSSFDHSGKTISSEESMKSFDSEISSNLGSIEVSDASETLVPSTADIDLEFDENELRLSSLHTVSDIILDAENPLELDSDESAGQMRRSHEMIFAHVESSNTTDMPNRKVSEEEFNVQQFSTTLGDASNLSISFSTASNADTIIENIQEDMATSYDAVSLVGSYERRASLMNDIFSSQEKVPHAETDNDRITEIDNMTPRRSKGHKRNDSTCIDLAKLSQESTDSLLDEEMIIHDVREEDEQKESGSDSDYDRYETEYSRSFKTPESKNFQRKKKAMSPKSAQKPEQEQTERKKSIPNIETIVEVSEDDIQKLRNHGISQNMNIYNYSIIPNIKITDITDDPTKCFEKMEPITVPEKKKPINQDQN
ncbi:uncharacterized protein LOC116351139 isoform X2 [Contarinia nasturtii]|uniref:uncharacterized protein LOC116351139 isoform X2 n=1 Tax=Contarinia nasturtii TaxID=265458 RepID=UPI0012D477BE|nr:uncharacterized protein LOC116351139 isoform X2 [Contarinia nasturtii]